MFVVVCYDIVDDKKRNSVLKVLKDYGRRIQKSVFECDLDRKHLDRMVEQALKYIDNKEDSLVIYHLCEGCIPKTESYGREIFRDDIMIV
jgi:CRISPR-associated protein Cas2